MRGEVHEVKPSGQYNIEEVVAIVSTDRGNKELKLYQKWPVRTPRPVRERRPIQELLITGQRVLDIFRLQKVERQLFPVGSVQERQ